jgi:transcription initiation factor TFIIIB Brf1 subunit/transcription initiation factor TFIIB
MSIAATVLYLAYLQYGDESKTQRYFAEAAGISNVTIRNRRQELQNKIPSMTSKKE